MAVDMDIASAAVPYMPFAGRRGKNGGMALRTVRALTYHMA